MAVVKDPTNPTESGITRRGLFRRLGLGLGGLAFLNFIWIAGDIIRPRKRRETAGGTDTIFTAGPVADFEPGTVTAFPEGRFYLVRLAEGGFLALNRSCTHLGCTLPWIEQDQAFACPCHASSFDIKGEVLSPPASRALDMFAIRIENQVVKVDLGRVIKRTGFEPVQVTMP